LKDTDMADELNLVEITADIVSSHVTNNNVSVGDLPNLIQQVHQALTSLGQPQPEPQAEKKTPVVSARASVKPDFLVCMECGKKQKTLRRHLQSVHGMTPDHYRAEFGLSRDYPMVAPEYSGRRREMAHSIGLGRKRAPAAEAGAPEEASKPSRGRGRKPKAASASE
jgi:predicted transcriptional regulator